MSVMDFEAAKTFLRERQERIALGRRRQAAVFRGEKPDRPPALTSGVPVEAHKNIPDYSMSRQFNDLDAMLVAQVKGICRLANAGDDSVPSVRGNFGCGTLLSCVGLEQEVLEDDMPWLKQHLTRDQIAALDPSQITFKGTFKRALDFTRMARETFGDLLPVFSPDTQGPFDLAHLVMGDDIFLAIYDDPALVHHLMEYCLELSIRGIEAFKELAGEPRNEHHHNANLYAPNMGIRICEDTTVIVGPETIDTFAIPYSVRLAEHFGGAWIHYCGRNDHLTEIILQNPVFKGINFGLVPGKIHDQNFEKIRERCLETETCYIGQWPRFDDENVETYLRRVHGWAREGYLLPRLPDFPNDAIFSDPRKVLEFWYSLT